MTFINWLNYFEENRDHFSHIRWSDAEKLTPAELSVVLESLQQFQKGENSEGKNLMNYAIKSGLPHYAETIKLFIREEQKHALVLGEFMRLNNIPKIKSHWVDGVFRGLRKLAGLENSIVVLITAEIIAAIFYRAFRDATSSKTLKNICDQILRDEEMHINFQSFTLQHFYRSGNFARRTFIRSFHRILMGGTTIVVWLCHRKVLRAGGFSFFSWRREVLKEFYRSVRMIKGVDAIEIRKETKQDLKLRA